MQNPQPNPDQPSQARSASIPPWVIILLLVLGVGAAGVYVWKELGAAPQRKSLPQSLKIDPGADVKPDRNTIVSTNPSATLPAPRRTTARRAATPPLPQGTDPGPTLVTLKLSNVPAQQAIEELAKQVGATVIRDQNGGWEEFDQAVVNINVDKVPFWTAMRDLLKQSKVDIPSYYYGRGGEDLSKTIVLSRAYMQYHNYPMHHVGSFVIIPSNIYRTFTADLTAEGKPQRENMNIQMGVMAEPKLGVLDIRSEAVVEEAVDENGKSLLSRTSTGYSSSPSNRLPWFSTVNIRLFPPADVGKRIAKVRGYVSAMIQGKQDVFEIEDPLTKTDVSKTYDGLPIEFRYLRKEGGVLRAKFTVHANSNDPRVRAGFANYATATRLLDEAGAAYRSNSGGASHGSTMFEFYVNFHPGNNAAAPKKIVLNVPIGMNEIRVPFEFKDLTMP